MDFDNDFNFLEDLFNCYGKDIVLQWQKVLHDYFHGKDDEDDGEKSVGKYPNFDEARIDDFFYEKLYEHFLLGFMIDQEGNVTDERQIAKPERREELIDKAQKRMIETARNIAYNWSFKNKDGGNFPDLKRNYEEDSSKFHGFLRKLYNNVLVFIDTNNYVKKIKKAYKEHKRPEILDKKCIEQNREFIAYSTVLRIIAARENWQKNALSWLRVVMDNAILEAIQRAREVSSEKLNDSSNDNSNESDDVFSDSNYYYGSDGSDNDPPDDDDSGLDDEPPEYDYNKLLKKISYAVFSKFTLLKWTKYVLKGYYMRNWKGDKVYELIASHFPSKPGSVETIKSDSVKTELSAMTNDLINEVENILDENDDLREGFNRLRIISKISVRQIILLSINIYICDPIINLWFQLVDNTDYKEVSKLGKDELVSKVEEFSKDPECTGKKPEDKKTDSDDDAGKKPDGSVKYPSRMEMIDFLTWLWLAHEDPQWSEVRFTLLEWTVVAIKKYKSLYVKNIFEHIGNTFNVTTERIDAIENKLNGLISFLSGNNDLKSFMKKELDNEIVARYINQICWIIQDEWVGVARSTNRDVRDLDKEELLSKVFLYFKPFFQENNGN